MPRPKKPSNVNWFEVALNALRIILENAFDHQVDDRRGEPEIRTYTVLTGIARNPALFNLFVRCQVIERAGRFVQIPPELAAAAITTLGSKVKRLTVRVVYRVYTQQFNLVAGRLQWSKTRFRPTWNNLRRELELRAFTRRQPDFGFDELPPDDVERNPDAPA